MNNMSHQPTCLDVAKESFLTLLGELPDDCVRKGLLQWIHTDLINNLAQDTNSRLDLKG